MYITQNSIVCHKDLPSKLNRGQYRFICQQAEHPDRCKPDSVPFCNGGNHLSVRPEPEVYNAASNDSLPIWSCCGRSLPRSEVLTFTRWALTPPFHPYQRLPAGGLLSVALVFLRNIVRSTLLFKRAPRSMQSGLSSAGKILPAAIARDQNVPFI